MNDGTIVVAGATGNLGGRIARALVEQGVGVKALVRHGTAQHKLDRLREIGVTIASVDLRSPSQVTPACSRASCVVSALQGLRDAIVETQTVLLDAAIDSDVPRFIPSDFSIDFTRFPPGENRNLDLRRDFHKRLDKTSIAATTIFQRCVCRYADRSDAAHSLQTEASPLLGRRGPAHGLHHDRRRSRIHGERGS